ncbi:vWA domain-containing protein [Brevibacillus thermoruber]|uniref:vWA domain-containing protein n=1 Tax=Brevibacillus thermoruber TaxID=33942 RepID=UPI0005599343|nr:VWA domain-containing protein [Brevibacillus thermoruber]
MKGIKLLISALILAAAVSACSGGEQEQAPEQTVQQPTGENKTIDEGPAKQELTREEKLAALKALIPDGATKIPETAEEIATFPIGRYAGTDSSEHEQELREFIKQLPAIDNPDEETIKMYYLALLGLFAEDYPDPQQVIDEIKLASFGSPEIDDPRYQFKEQYNVEIILDASGSMAAQIGGKTKMEAAKEAIQAFAETLPKEAHVALRVYGHKGSGKDADKALSCGSSELVYGLQPYDAKKLQSSLNQFQPAGWTPIARALQEAQKDLSGITGEKSTTLIYLVSDGIETCGGNPAEAAKQLANSSITPLVNVIGFDVDGEEQKQLKAIAEAAGGRYVSIQDQKELREEFRKAEEIADQWYQWKSKESSGAYHRKVDSLINNTEFKLNWKFLASDEDENMDWMIRQLEEEGRFSEELVDRLEKIQDQHYRTVRKQADELEDFLDSLVKKTYKETIEAIQQHYNSNVTGK